MATTDISPLGIKPQHEAFIAEYLTNGFNATQAALSAGYKPTNARVQASQLLTRPDIQAAIRRKQAQIAVQVEYTQAQWLSDTLEIGAEARKLGKHNSALKAQELVGRHIGALTSTRKLSADEARAFTHFGAAMERDYAERLNEERDRALAQLPERASVREGAPG